MSGTPRASVIVVATEDFELYHGVVTELRARGIEFTTVRPGEEVPERTAVLVAARGEEPPAPPGVDRVLADPDRPRQAVEEALAVLRGGEGRTVAGIDPGERPGIAILSGGTVVAAFQVPAGQTADAVREELAGSENPLVRIGDGARLIGARILDELELPVELVDETGTTPYLGSGARGMGDVLAAVNIARREGRPVESRDIEPTEGEIRRIQDRSREVSEHNRAIDAALARRVATGELTIREALNCHRNGDEDG